MPLVHRHMGARCAKATKKSAAAINTKERRISGWDNKGRVANATGAASGFDWNIWVGEMRFGR